MSSEDAVWIVDLWVGVDDRPHEVRSCVTVMSIDDAPQGVTVFHGHHRPRRLTGHGCPPRLGGCVNPEIRQNDALPDGDITRIRDERVGRDNSVKQCLVAATVAIGDNAPEGVASDNCVRSLGV